jgi:hypothetical protein
LRKGAKPARTIRKKPGPSMGYSKHRLLDAVLRILSEKNEAKCKKKGLTPLWSNTIPAQMYWLSIRDSVLMACEKPVQNKPNLTRFASLPCILLH